MTNKERRDREMVYISDDSVMEEQKVSCSGNPTARLLTRHFTVITVPTSRWEKGSSPTTTVRFWMWPK